MIREIKMVDEYQSKILTEIQKKGFRIDFVVENSKISKPTFYRKIKNKSFTTSELFCIAKLLEPNYETTEEIVQSLLEASAEIEDGNFLTHEEVMLNRRKNLAENGN